MVKHKRENLLSHPVVGSLLHYKWNTFGHYGYYINLLTFSLLVLFLNLYALLLESPISDKCIAVHANSTRSPNLPIDDGHANNTSLVVDCDVIKPKQVFIYVAASLVILTALFRFFHETSRVIQNKSVVKMNYFARLVLYITSFLFVAVYWADCQCIALWQWQCGVLAVLLSWLNLTIFIAKFPLTGIYIIMLLQVFYTFLKVVLLSSLLVLAFGISFYMAFHEPSIKHSPFSTPARSLLKLMTMTAGELDFDLIFRQAPNGESDNEMIPFEVVSYILWVIFIVVMPILLANMLVGLAVGDIDRIQKAASLKKLALQVNQVLAVEKSLRIRPFKKIFTIAWKKIYPNSQITSIPASDVWKLYRKGQIWKKLRNRIEFAVWGGERYDGLKGITDSLSKSKLHDVDTPAGSSDTVAVTAEIEEVQQQLQNTENKMEELVEEVKSFREELKSALKLLAEIAERTKAIFHPQTPATPLPPITQ